MTRHRAEIHTVSLRLRVSAPGSIYSQLLFLYGCFLIGSVAALHCEVPPQYITARPAPRSFAAELGTPPQQLSLLLSTILNETYIPSTIGCSKFQQYGFTSSSDCENSLGGVFNPDNSSTYDRIQGLNFSDFMENPARSANGSIGSDIFRLPQATLNVTIDKFQFGLIDETVPIGYEIGLGPGSSLLRRLMDMKSIPSNSYGIDPLLPALTLGGYDLAGFTGSFHDYPLPSGTNHSSYLHVSVADIIIEYPHRPEKPAVSLMTGSDASQEPFDISIDPFPDILPILLPQDVTRAFMKEAGAETIASRNVPEQQDMLLLAPDMNNTLHYPNRFDGVMKVVLSDGFNTTIPNELLIWNTTTRTNETIWMSGVGMPSFRQHRFGSSFLNSGVYLAVNYEGQKFSLANSAFNVDSNKFSPLTGGRLVAMGCEPDLVNSSQGSKKPAPRVIVGAVIGALAGALCLGFLGWLGFRWYWVYARKPERIELDEAQIYASSGNKRTVSEFGDVNEDLKGNVSVEGGGQTARPLGVAM